jgi:hypothetical protein
MKWLSKEDVVFHGTAYLVLGGLGFVDEVFCMGAGSER